MSVSVAMRRAVFSAVLCLFLLSVAAVASDSDSASAPPTPPFPGVVRSVALGVTVQDFVVAGDVLYWMTDEVDSIFTYNLTSNSSLSTVDLSRTVQGQGLRFSLFPVTLHMAGGLLWVGEWNNNVNIVLRTDGTLVRLYGALEGVDAPLYDFVFPSPDGVHFAENLRTQQWRVYNASTQPDRTGRLTPLYTISQADYYSNPVFAREQGVDLIYWVTSSQDWRNPRMHLIGYVLSNGSVWCNVSMPADELLLQQTTWVTLLERLSDGTFVLGGGFEDGYPKPLCYYRPQATTPTDRLQCQKGLTNADINLHIDAADRVWRNQPGNSSILLVLAAPQPTDAPSTSSSSSAAVAPPSSPSAATSRSSSAQSSGSAVEPVQSSASSTSPSSSSVAPGSVPSSSTSAPPPPLSSDGVAWTTSMVALVAVGSLLVGAALALLACTCRRRRGKETTAISPLISVQGSTSTLAYNDLDTPMLVHAQRPAAAWR